MIFMKQDQNLHPILFTFFETFRWWKRFLDKTYIYTKIVIKAHKLIWITVCKSIFFSFSFKLEKKEEPKFPQKLLVVLVLFQLFHEDIYLEKHEVMIYNTTRTCIIKTIYNFVYLLAT